MNRKIKLLVLGDAPTVTTGFADVVRNVLAHFPDEIEVHIWGIGFNGTGYWEYPNWRIFPTGPHWLTEGLNRFLGLLATGGYTHVWLLNDLNVFSHSGFPAQLRHLCATRKIRSLLYFPVDAAVEREWTEIIERVDVAATYTQYGVDQVRRAGCLTPLQIVPHGVSDFFRPLGDAGENRKRVLADIVVNRGEKNERPFATEEDFLVLNVNKNEWRKDPYRSLEILAGLKQLGLPAKLLLRMAPTSHMGGVHLEYAAASLGLKLDEDWMCVPQVEPETLRELYNAADLYLTTTLGEGWGLGITEALACGCPVALPLHTSCEEIVQGALNYGVEAQRWVPLFPAKERVFGPIDARVRWRVNLDNAVRDIGVFAQKKIHHERPALPEAAQQWLSWPRISARLQELLFGK